MRKHKKFVCSQQKSSITCVTNVVENFQPKEISKVTCRRRTAMKNYSNARNAMAGSWNRILPNLSVIKVLSSWSFYRFKTKYQLSMHSKVHEEFKPIACEICDKRFRQKQSLTEHMRIHNNIFPYKCEYCERKFRHTSTLKVTHPNNYVAQSVRINQWIRHICLLFFSDAWTHS